MNRNHFIGLVILVAAYALHERGLFVALSPVSDIRAGTRTMKLSRVRIPALIIETALAIGVRGFTHGLITGRQASDL